MNILVVGANGATGRQVVRKLQDSSQYTPIAGVRKQEQVEEFKSQGVDARLVDVRETVTQIVEKLSGIDTIVFTAGGGSSMLVDLDGKVKTAKAAEQAGVKRFILISAGGIHHFHDDDRLEWMNDYEEYSAAMYYSDLWVEHSNLNYTIIRPGHLSNEAGTGMIQIGEYLPHKSITREDVALVVIASLQNERTIRKAFDIIGGNISIEEALSSL
ncbi:SDR family oxidoreductase [Priestia megaterium]|uniref:SDR family oxidoreductase n=1 Tax=Priestia megaterium TaxID=1404 RepID=UPI00336AF0A1